VQRSRPPRGAAARRWRPAHGENPPAPRRFTLNDCVDTAIDIDDQFRVDEPAGRDERAGQAATRAMKVAVMTTGSG